MKKLKILSLLAYSAFSASQLSANITMTLDPSCSGCNVVEISPQPRKYVQTRLENGKVVVTFPSDVKPGTSVIPQLTLEPYNGCNGYWQYAESNGTLYCGNPYNKSKEIVKPHSRSR